MIEPRVLSAVHRMMRGRQNVYTSNLLRQHGYSYKVAFGCSLPDIKDIARRVEVEIADGESLFFRLDATELAEALWADEAVRESRLLAPLIYPRGTMTVEVAERWARQITTYEVADVVCMYAFQFGIGPQLISLWEEHKEPMLRYCANSLKKRLS